MTLQEQVARELCRWFNLGWDDYGINQAYFRREARKLVKMVCGSCGLAKPLASMEDRK